ncbi:hypothetical protein HDE_00437 [Halotydeus destructor]|nr:hypothetical protein HDE_00437 [Halotydeus destructor]
MPCPYSVCLPLVSLSPSVDSAESTRRPGSDRRRARHLWRMDGQDGRPSPSTSSFGRQRMLKIRSSSGRQSSESDSTEASLSSAKRKLFTTDDEDEEEAGDDDEDEASLAKRKADKRIAENIRYAKSELDRQQQESCRTWDFDFKAGRPLATPCHRFQWTEVGTEAEVTDSTSSADERHSFLSECTRNESPSGEGGREGERGRARDANSIVDDDKPTAGPSAARSRNKKKKKNL